MQIAALKEACAGDKYFPQELMNIPEETGNIYLSDEYAFGMIRGWDEDWDDKVLGVIVAPDHRRKGYGEIMCRKLLATARKRGLERVRLHVDKDNEPAYSLYKKLGFQFDGTERANGELIGFYVYNQ
jgi:ribosomal protein S18 acetylase RimI-like enzyme